MTESNYDELGGPDPADPLLDPDDEAERDYTPETADYPDPGDPAADPGANLYDTTWSPPDRQPRATRYGTTLSEEREGESLDARLSEEEPDVQAELADQPEGPGGGPDRLARSAEQVELGDGGTLELDRDEIADVLGGEPDAGDQPGTAAHYDGAQPRAGRLVDPDDGAHADTEPDLIARDAGRAGDGASAEEAAVHLVDGE